ncbi:hypothetical protein GCM10009636_32680 [Arthrobacter koreensis]|uniref:hypothetical protein n=1 Tax=Arthrobacter koreensis TaxID=199136 RepID=UPI001264CB05|nr:hypothetical protein [Arthrobacter koreensis]
MPDKKLELGGEHDVFVLSTVLERIRDEFLYRSEDPTERTGAPFLEWAAAAENLRLQVLE